MLIEFNWFFLYKYKVASTTKNVCKRIIKNSQPSLIMYRGYCYLLMVLIIIIRRTQMMLNAEQRR